MRPNNFDLARLLLAANVLLFHCYALSNLPKLHIFQLFNYGNWAVEGFFAISGMLIFASYDRCRTLKEYSIKRARRIVPAYLVSTVLCIAIGVGFTRAFHVGKFLFANLTLMNFLHPGISGVFEHNPGNADMNGALWTIKVEVMFYLSVPILVYLCRRFGRLQVLVPAIILSVAYHYAMAGHRSLSVQLPGQLSFFLVGSLVYYYLPLFKRRGGWLMLFAALALAAYLYTGFYFLKPFCIPLLVLGFSLLLPEMKFITRWGDFSYGTYVLHYPIIQTLVAVGLFARSAWLGVAASVAIVSVAAALSWFLVEERALGRQPHAKAETPGGEKPSLPKRDLAASTAGSK